VARFRRAAIPANAFAARLGALAAILGLCVVTQLRGGAYSERELGALYALVLAGFLLAAAYGALAVWSQPKRLPLFELAGDALLLAGFVYVAGGARSIFGFLYLVWIVYGALRLGPRGAVAASACAVVAYTGVVWGPAAGWIPPFDPASRSTAEEAMPVLLGNALAFLAVGLLSRRLAIQIATGRRELHELSELHRRIVDGVSSGLLTVSRAGTITSFNREAEQISGYAAEDVLGVPLVQLFPSLARSGALPPLERMQVQFRARDGRALHLGMSVSVLRDLDGQPDGAIVIFQDLTHVVEMEEQLRRSERLSAVGQLAAGLAHEIRNPLASLSGSIELLAVDLPQGDASSRTLREIVQRETARLNRLVSDFLTYARPGIGRAEPVALLPLFTELRELVARDGANPVDVKIDVPEALQALGNPDQLRQVFWNLLLNAAQSEPADAAVHVRATARANSELEISIEDRGCGIPPDALERIFEPFFTTRAKGTGLGLATVHRVVEAHGGRIAVSSERGKGTTVRVFLPCA
jgi:two-component system sensor histidine kinase PilS (NtrC family)